MRDIIRSLLTAKVSGGGQGAGGSSVQPDWNQNDETAADYVKNRPYYVTEKTVSANDIIGANMYPLSVTTEDNGTGFGVAMTPEVLVPADVGETVIVSLNGKSYTCVMTTDGCGAPIVQGAPDFSEYPFVITSSAVATASAGEYVLDVQVVTKVCAANYLPRFTVESTWSAETMSASVTVEDAESLAEQWYKGVPCFVSVRTSQAVVNKCAVVDVSGIIIYAIGFGLGGFITAKINTTTGEVTTHKYTAT